MYYVSIDRQDNLIITPEPNIGSILIAAVQDNEQAESVVHAIVRFADKRNQKMTVADGLHKHRASIMERYKGTPPGYRMLEAVKYARTLIPDLSLLEAKRAIESWRDSNH